MMAMELNLTEFIKTGKFGFLELGMTKNEIINQHFPPEDWLSKKTKENSEIWRYGNFELHFDESSKLLGIFNDYIPELNGGENIKIKDYWLLKDGNYTPSLGEIVLELNNMELDYSKKTESYGTDTLVLTNGVYLMFEAPTCLREPQSSELYNKDTERSRSDKDLDSLGMSANDAKLSVIGKKENNSIEKISNKNEEWYIAEIITKCEAVEKSNKKDLRRVTTWGSHNLFKATSLSQAYDKAVKFGKNSEHSFINGYNIKMEWLFVGISELLPIYEDIEDCSEIMWTDYGFISDRKTKRMVKDKKWFLENLKRDN